MSRSLLITLPALLLGSACAGVGPKPATHYDIGGIHRAVTTTSPEAQLWFDRGLGLAYGFNHEEAVVCFDRAIAADPGCAMAYWGKAYALGPNYNATTIEAPMNAAALEAVGEARLRYADAAPVERDLIRALSTRYAEPMPDDRAGLDRAYAEAMREVHATYPDDAGVAGLYAEALMQLKPWGLWSPDGEPAPVTAEIRAVLEPALERWPDHPALCHLYIHTMEAGPEVARAIPAARRLEGLTPGLGHLVHMPSHIYTWTGRYDDVVRVNIEACAIDDAFVAHAGKENFYTLYRIHNYHFVAYGAMWDGRRELALRYARAIGDEIPEAFRMGLPDFVDVFHATHYHVMVRFGMWEELLQEPEPEGDHLVATRAVWRYARGVALASLGRIDEAEAEYVAFVAARSAVPATRYLFQNPVEQVLAVADHVLAGEIAYRRGEHDRAFELLREAVRLDVALNYDEPWGWMEPARHALGALLTEQGRYAQAIQVYQANLARYPENGWALHGLAECLRGLGRDNEAADVERRFEAAWERSDVTIPGSCFCKAG